MPKLCILPVRYMYTCIVTRAFLERSPLLGIPLIKLTYKMFEFNKKKYIYFRFRISIMNRGLFIMNTNVATIGDSSPVTQLSILNLKIYKPIY